MALTDEEKLRNLASEALDDAAKISSEIEENTKKEFKEKLEIGEKKLLADIQDYVQSEIEKIRREKSLQISQENIKTRQEYFKYAHSTAETVLNKATDRLKDFIKSESYGNYLFESCRNVIEKTDGEINILYMPADEEIINKIKERLLQNKEITKTAKNIKNIEFQRDESIHVGGLRFYYRTRNIMINDVFDEKIERAKELLGSLIGPQFTAI